MRVIYISWSLDIQVILSSQTLYTNCALLWRRFDKMSSLLYT